MERESKVHATDETSFRTPGTLGPREVEERLAELQARELTPEAFARAAESVRGQLELRLDDVLDMLNATRAQYGNVKVMKPITGDGSMRPEAFRIQRRDGEFVLVVR